jgi:transcriptional regulator with XRE-family HTH domain
MKDKLLKKMGHIIKFKRIEDDISQEKLAEITGLSVQSISAIENGLSNIKFKNLYTISHALDLDIGVFSKLDL